MQKHTRQDRTVHWDLMLDVGGALQTYRLELPPVKLLHQTTTTLKIFDHPLRFLTYQGDLTKNKGSVEIVDTGTYRLLQATEYFRQLQINGKILKGTLALKHIETDRWELYFLNAGRSGST